jgi:hypothetical protein
MCAQFAGAIRRARMPEHIEQHLRLPPIGGTECRAPLRFLPEMRVEREGLPQMLVQSPIAGGEQRV